MPISSMIVRFREEFEAHMQAAQARASADLGVADAALTAADALSAEGAAAHA